MRFGMHEGRIYGRKVTRIISEGSPIVSNVLQSWDPFNDFLGPPARFYS